MPDLSSVRRRATAWSAFPCLLASALTQAPPPATVPVTLPSPTTTTTTEVVRPVAAAPVATAPTAEELEARRRDKLAQPFLRLAPWHTNLESARRSAARTGKLVLVHCTRTFTPCGTSIRCERGVLSSPEFVTFADRVVLCVHTSAQVDATEDQRLSEWRGSGWPHHVLLDATGRVLATHESWREKTVPEFAAMVDSAERFLEVERSAATATADQNWLWLREGLASGSLSLAEAQTLFANSGVRTSQEAEDAAMRIADLEVAQILTGLDRQDPNARERAGKAFVAMHRAGKRPHARNAARDYWGALALHCEAQGEPDLALWNEAIAELEARFADERGYQRFLEERRQKRADRGGKAAAESIPKAPTEPRRGA